MDDFVGSCKHPKTQDDFDKGYFFFFIATSPPPSPSPTSNILRFYCSIGDAPYFLLYVCVLVTDFPNQRLFLPQTAGQTGPVMRVSMPYSAKVKFVTCTSAGAAPLKSMQSCPELTYANALPVPAMNSVRQSAYEEALDGQQEPVQDMTKEFIKSMCPCSTPLSPFCCCC